VNSPKHTRSQAARNRIPGGSTSGVVPHARSFSVTDGRVTIGSIARYADKRNGERWLSCDTEGRVRGSYATMEAAIAALPAPKVQP
jgi:hypothetical protein